MEKPEKPALPDHSVNRRVFIGLAAAGLLAAAGVGTYEVLHHAPQPASPEKTGSRLIEQAGASLLAMHEVDPSSGGWKFKSAIQSPHYQTDRDVGASSVAMGFLELAQAYPQQPQWLDAAVKTSDWLTSIARTDSHGNRYWNDYVDGNDASSSAYTSFDDGAIGIGDFYWQLYEQTHDPSDKAIALSSVEWTLAQAEAIGSGSTVQYRWRWDTSDPNSPHYLGMGEGSAGIITALASFYDRTKTTDPAFAAACKQYIDGAARYLANARVDGSIPETGDRNGDGGTALNSGYLSGAAGSVYMYLTLYKTFGDQTYLDSANTLLGWLDTPESKGGPRVDFGDNTTAWNLMLDSQDTNDTKYATGFEEGNAGIGWTYLQAYAVTGDARYLASATSAADWLIKVADHSNGGLSWPEDEHPTSTVTHANLNNGAAGIGMFLRDVYVATNDSKYQTAAEGALSWLARTAKTDNDGPYWNDNDGEADYTKDPSWHWGTAGIIAAAIHIGGGNRDIPGEEPALTNR